MTRKELKERFSFFGKIEECTVHFRENGYGFSKLYLFDVLFTINKRIANTPVISEITMALLHTTTQRMHLMLLRTEAS